MDIKDLEKYIGKKVFFILRNGFKYKIILKPEFIRGEILSFPDKFNDLVSFNISEINFIKVTNEE